MVFLAWRGFLFSDDKLHYFCEDNPLEAKSRQNNYLFAHLTDEASTSRTKQNETERTKEEEPKHLQHDAHKDKPQTIFVPSFNEAIKREHQQNAKKDEAVTSRHALL